MKGFLQPFDSTNNLWADLFFYINSQDITAIAANIIQPIIMIIQPKLRHHLNFSILQNRPSDQSEPHSNAKYMQEVGSWAEMQNYIDLHNHDMHSA